MKNLNKLFAISFVSFSAALVACGDPSNNDDRACTLNSDCTVVPGELCVKGFCDNGKVCWENVFNYCQSCKKDDDCKHEVNGKSYDGKCVNNGSAAGSYCTWDNVKLDSNSDVDDSNSDIIDSDSDVVDSDSDIDDADSDVVDSNSDTDDAVSEVAVIEADN